MGAHVRGPAGGGSGFGPPGTSFQTGVAEVGKVIITYDPATDACPPPPPPSPPAAPAVVLAPRFTG